MNESQRKWMLESSLSALDTNFYERGASAGKSVKTFTPPTLAEVTSNYAQDAELREKISVILTGSDPIKRLYAAILVSEVDWAKANDTLQKFTNDDTKLFIQARLGFKIVETKIAIPARDFLTERQIRGENFSKEEILSDWATAVWNEKKESKQNFNKDSLPKWKDVLDAREDAAKMEKLRTEIDRLKNADGAAEKFYAAALLNTIDKEESRKVLESLLTEETTVLILSGDEADNIPARQVAESMLNPRTSFQTSPPSNPIARATKWLQKNFFDTKSGD